MRFTRMLRPLGADARLLNMEYKSLVVVDRSYFIGNKAESPRRTGVDSDLSRVYLSIRRPSEIGRGGNDTAQRRPAQEKCRDFS